MFFSTKRNFSFEQIPDLSGKVAIITGSNTGIGKVCALEMARKNCTVVLACRNEEKTKAVVEQIKSETGNQNVEFIRIDLLELASIKQFVEQFLTRHDQLHILINNAGVMCCSFGLSKDNIEIQFATNHVAHYYLTSLLWPTIVKSTPSCRIVNVSSIGHMIPFKELNLESISDPAKYNKIIHYAKSKTCNILFTRELTKRLQDKDINNVYVNCSHPGAVKTDLYRHLTRIDEKTFVSFINLFLITPEDGAITQLYLATSPEVEQKDIKGHYYVPYASPNKPYGVAASKDAPKELWDFTEKLLKEKVPDYTGFPI
ncbi:NAD(P)-binding protein [Cokeromyces recurvatus]|uniref:NAD(P)-binding protein n=1 Tax=Cokeromyces recurvatus TaxID=90255 RepID=UPI002220A90B|nr:NAD(P)-binding protein [Cokeromyces recurvatus]KAI7906118.1 NAD(P)-binding protein [Cokeromyces recurvatus]